jgi:lipase chaperone LimK
MRGRIVLLAVAIAAGGLLWWGAQGRAPHLATTQARGDAVIDESAAETAPMQGDAATAMAAATTRDSLRGTAADGAVHVDAKGRPVADRELRRLFDYFISRIGERNEQQIRADLLAYLGARLDQGAVAQVLAWFDSYVTLQRSASALAGEGGDPRAAVARLRSLRAQRMGEQIAQAWWGDEDRYLDYTLARQDLLADSSLSAEERARRLGELDQSLDPSRQALRREEDAAQRTLSQSEDYIRRDVPAAQRYAEREQEYGAQAAKRLAALDQQRAAWDGRLRDYASARKSILSDTRLSPAQRESRLSELLAHRFDATERLRVDALARNDLLPR